MDTVLGSLLTYSILRKDLTNYKKLCISIVIIVKQTFSPLIASNNIFSKISLEKLADFFEEHCDST